MNENVSSPCYLRPATANDIEALHRLFNLPDVYRYLADGAAPPRSVSEDWVETSKRDFAQQGIGLWLLIDGDQLAGAVRMEIRPEPRTAELSYLLHPDYWGRGLATQMSWSAILRVFEGPFDQIIAGVDGPNEGSAAVVKRLGMRPFKDVNYPTGPGKEYVLAKTDPHPQPEPSRIPFSD